MYSWIDCESRIHQNKLEPPLGGKKGAERRKVVVVVKEIETGAERQGCGWCG